MDNVDTNLQMEQYLKGSLIKDSLKNMLITWPDIQLDGLEDNGKMDQLMDKDKYIIKMEYLNMQDKLKMDISMDQEQPIQEMIHMKVHGKII